MRSVIRAPAAGRNWEAFGSDPYLTGIANAGSVKGLQDEGVIACAKHFVGNEREFSIPGIVGLGATN